MKVRGPWAAAVVIALLAGIGIAGLFYVAQEPEIAPIARPDPASFDAATIERGRVLANYGDCTACHTRPGGPAFAGNLPLRTPFGTISAGSEGLRLLNFRPRRDLTFITKDEFLRRREVAPDAVSQS
jgi:hypothetical protein